MGGPSGPLFVFADCEFSGNGVLLDYSRLSVYGHARSACETTRARDDSIALPTCVEAFLHLSYGRMEEPTNKQRWAGSSFFSALTRIAS